MLGTARGEQYYYRHVDEFRGLNVGLLGVRKLDDHGFQLQGSAMLLPEVLQLYVGGSQIYGGRYGKPWDTKFGLNWFPFATRALRWNNEVMYVYGSPSGGLAYPYLPGTTGWIYHTNLEVAF